MSGCEDDWTCDDMCPENHSTIVKEVLMELFGDVDVDITNITKEQRQQFRKALQKRGIRPCIKCAGNVLDSKHTK